ncbi:hypothetical protein MSMTP_1956 [Methanosarcina sp. MTP4]|uniref:hypothetical protein n=1 Tax=Methanosarcina sp. MTP4 TaxID=1434100 RepID=UPI00061566DF|nr:hypothetical protein [Methanosarcina sp. MTP4]AKB25425.1 hypothetical protein MSMTP_1956 [Methanosarcina sp. MTP4]
MVSLKDIMDEASAKLGDVKFKGLMLKEARIKNGAGRTPEDVLGWDYIFRTNDGVCYSFYGAQFPLIGLTQAVPILCPLGIQTFDSYEIDFKKAIEILNTMNCGDVFVAMTLSWPLTPECTEPYWHIRTSLGNDISIGANSGKPNCNKI